MAEKKGNRYCVAGGPNDKGCKNSAATPGISFHKFPNDKRRSSWIHFVQKHRETDWKPSKSSVLCSVHFEPQCYVQRTDLVGITSDVKTKAWLTKTAIPTIDSVNITNKPSTSSRDKRQVRLLRL